MPGPKQESLATHSLIGVVYQKFSKVPDIRSFAGKPTIRLVDHLMCGLAIFGLKFPSLLQYDKKKQHPEIEENLKTLYRVQKTPCDSYLSERLDQVDPVHLRPAFTKLFSLLQRGKKLEAFEFYNGHYLLSADGTGSFSSGKISCPHCCVKKT